MDGKVGRLVTYIIEKDHPLARRGLKIRDELIEKNNILIEKQNKIIEEQKKLLKNSYDDGVVRGIIWAVAQPKEAVLLVERWRVIHGQRAATG
jgi:hypothetical protein